MMSENNIRRLCPVKLSFKKLGFTLSFTEKVIFDIPPSFVLRSVIGRELRRLCCVSRDTACGECMFSQSCVYGFAFESIVPKDNQVLTGRNRISHPVIIETEKTDDAAADSLRFYLIFLGAAVKYLPYFYYALKNSGKAGILKGRFSFTVTQVRDGSHPLLVNEETLDTGFSPDVWEYEPSTGTAAGGPKSLMLRLRAPLRFKAGGRYTSGFSAEDFALCLHRRAQTLCSQYGVNDSGEYRFSGGWDIAERDLVWRDYTHYSARQKRAIRLGGITGTMVLSGDFSPYEYAILRFAEIFHAGKNTNFGLGKIEIWEKT
jgi:hypothetical protein